MSREFTKSDIGKKLFILDESGDLDYAPKRITGISRQGLPIIKETYSQYIPENKYVFVKK